MHSQYALSKQEITRGIANRFVHSRTYIFLYLTMAALSITTIALSVAEGCPGLAFYILEIIINTTMISEVCIRFVAFGKVSAHCYSDSNTFIENFTYKAILEIPLQRVRLGANAILCHYATGSHILWVWIDKQRRRDTRYTSSSSAKCSSIHPFGSSNATVSKSILFS